MPFFCASPCCELGLGHCIFQPGPWSGRSRCSENLHPQAGRQVRTQQHLYQDAKVPQTGGQKLTIRGHTLGARKEHQPGIHRPALTLGNLARWPSSLGLCSVLGSVLCGALFEVLGVDSWAVFCVLQGLVNQHRGCQLLQTQPCLLIV